MRLGFLVCVDEEIEKNQMFGIRYMPVWAYTLASYLRGVPGLEIFLYDTRIHPRDKTPHADIYLISGVNQDFYSLQAYEKQLRQMHPGSKLILGGPITSSYQLAGKLPELFSFDHVFIGDGETAIKDLVEKFMLGETLPKIIQNHVKFSLNQARAMDIELLQGGHTHYYGGVLEVSRGCPFLCEFCDIRTKPDNNVANNKPAAVILQELEQFLRLGIKDILFACDNFIGNHIWAENVCDQIIEWKKTHGYDLHLYTWLTINLSYHPKLMEKMKSAGFDMFFIGVESFGVEQLLETAKLQNVKTDIKESIRLIQSHGFIVVAGLIFGFDTDPEDVVQTALDGIKTSGLISGDPSLLTALPGTPLYRRMEKSKRLRNSKLGLGGKKYATNILYLRDREVMIKDFIRFVEEFNQPEYQYARFISFLGCLKASIANEQQKSGYINVSKLWTLAIKTPGAIPSLLKRFLGVMNSPAKLFYISKALLATMKNKNAKMTYFYFWLFNWSNSVLKYGGLKKEDFDIESVNASFEIKDIIPVDYETDFFEPIPATKIKAQRQATIKALKKLFTNAS